MATRRPKVPRADALARAPKKKADGGEIIRAEFGGARGSSAPAADAAPVAPKESAKKPAAKASSKTGTAKGASPTSVKAAAPKAAKAASAKAAEPKSAGTRDRAGLRDRAAKAAGSTEPEHAPVPAKAFSGRMLAFAVVMIAITVMLAPTVKIFLEKQAEISALRAEIRSKEAEQADLKKQISRWQDPEYVKQQARDRINMVMPGETGYWVFGGEVPAGTPGGRTGTGASGDPADVPWVDALWESIRRSATD